MINNGSWQADLLDALSTRLKAEQSVKALVLTGSLADDDVVTDEWSDVDLTAIVADTAVTDLASQRTWLTSLGTIVGLERHDTPRSVTLRVCFAPDHRVDVSLVSESVFREAVAREDPAASRAHKLLWSKIPETDQAIPRLFPKPTFDGISEQSISDIVEGFWLKASVAVAKTMRNDLLIALHLALDLERDCLVLQMIRRDRELGTNIHRTGGFGNDIVSRFRRSNDCSGPQEILGIIDRSARVLDELASDLLPSYTPRTELFLPALREAEAD